MVDKKLCNEIAVLFSQEETDVNGELRTILYPRRIVKGYYNRYDNVFIDENEIAYSHVVLGDIGVMFGKRITLSELLKKCPKSTLAEAKKEYLKEIRQKVYFYEDGEDRFSKYYIKEMSKDEKEITIFQDRDFDYFISLYGDLEIDEDSFSYTKQDKTNHSKTSNQKENISNGEPIDLVLIRDELSKTVIGQENAHNKILSTIWKNYSNGQTTSKNIFVNGPTGVGKTETFKIISDLINVPIIIEDCNEFTISGYKGRDVDEIIRDLIRASNDDFQLASRGIVVLDEIDKLASNGKDLEVSQSGIQMALLKMLESHTYTINSKTLETKGITFVALGAFSNIEKQEPTKLGFEAKQTKKEYKDITLEDLKKFGMKEEFLGRFKCLVSMKNLEHNDYKKILLESKISPLLEVKNFYQNLGINLIYTEDFIDEIAKQAMIYKTGVRGLDTALTDSLFEADNEIAFTPNSYYSSLLVNGETVSNPKKYTLKR